MLRERPGTPQVTQRTQYLAIYALVTLFFVVGTAVVFWWIVYRLRQPDFAPPKTVNATIYTNYDPSFPTKDTSPEVIAQWAEAQQAFAAYAAKHPQPQNVQILKGWSTNQIYAYMVNQVAGGLKVSCQYCHNINNFADYSNPQKIKAAGMMLMSLDLNKNWVSQLPASIGNLKVGCATCHNGQPVFNAYPRQALDLVPYDYRLPLDRDYPGGLQVTYKADGSNRKQVSLDDVALNQYTMYHMNASLGQGCTFCHNARYFPSNEIPQKGYAIIMLKMAKYLNGEGSVTLNIPNVDVAKLLPGGQNGTYTYKVLMNKKEPSCWMCHQGAYLPPAAVNPGQLPPQLSGEQ